MLSGDSSSALVSCSTALSKIALLAVELAAMLVGERGLGHQLAGLVEAFQRIVVASKPSRIMPRSSFVAACSGFEFERAVDVRQRIVVLLFAEEMLGAKPQVVGLFGLELDGASQIVQLLFRLALHWLRSASASAFCSGVASWASTTADNACWRRAHRPRAAIAAGRSAVGHPQLGSLWTARCKSLSANWRNCSARKPRCGSCWSR